MPGCPLSRKAGTLNSQGRGVDRPHAEGSTNLLLKTVQMRILPKKAMRKQQAKLHVVANTQSHIENCVLSAVFAFVFGSLQLSLPTKERTDLSAVAVQRYLQQ